MRFSKIDRPQARARLWSTLRTIAETLLALLMFGGFMWAIMFGASLPS